MKTAHLKCLHPFGTADWRKQEATTPTQVGEVHGAAWDYFPGGFHGAPPPQISVGNAGDFSADWPYPFPEPNRVSRCGIDSRCYVNAGKPYVDYECLRHVDHPDLQIVYTRLIELLYSDSVTIITNFLTSWFGPAAKISYFPTAGPNPAMVLVKSADVNLIVCSGTPNATVLGMQAFNSLDGPDEYGAYATLRFWADRAHLVEDRVRSMDMSEIVPAVLVGHSMGAATMGIVAVNMHLAQRFRDITMLGIGMPRTGDRRFANLINEISYLQLNNIEDAVAVVPPTGSELLPFLPIIGPLLFRKWGRWSKNGMTLLMDSVGNQVWTSEWGFGFHQLLPLVNNALLHNAPVPIPSHEPGEYIQRLLRIALPSKCCVDAEQWELLGLPLPPLLFGVEMAGAGEIEEIDGAGGVELGGGGVVGPVPGHAGLLLGGVGAIAPVPGHAGLLLGGVGAIAPVPGHAGLLLGGVGVVSPITGGGGVELGGGGGVGPVPGNAGLLLGGVGVVSPITGGGGVELGGGGGFVELSLGGGLLLGVVPPPLGPGASCAGSTGIDLDTEYSSTISGGGAVDWWHFDCAASTQYTLVRVSGSSPAVVGHGGTGACPAPTQIMIVDSIGPTSSATPGATRLRIWWPGSLMGAVSYTFKLTSP